MVNTAQIPVRVIDHDRVLCKLRPCIWGFSMQQESDATNETVANQIDVASEVEELNTKFLPLVAEFVDRDDWMTGERPLLAHYTSVETLAKILKNEELWLSNPLFMNDLDEMRFGLTRGKAFFDQADLEKSCGLDSEDAGKLRHAFNHYYTEYESKHALNVYILCLSKHSPDNTDGLLSMWRAYGNNGSGAAIVFDTAAVGPVIEDTPLILTAVRYASTVERLQWLEQKVAHWAALVVEAKLPPDRLYVAAYSLFSVILLFSLSTKHIGFDEEQEWRLIYMPERDQHKIYNDNFNYVVGARGVEPKLTLKIAPLPGAAAQFGFVDIVHSILLGPSISSLLATASVVRMLDKLGKGELAPKVRSSTIPLRHAWPL